MKIRVKVLLRRMATLCNCPNCGSASYYMGTDGKNHCMDCSHTWG